MGNGLRKGAVFFTPLRLAPVVGISPLTLVPGCARHDEGLPRAFLRLTLAREPVEL
jgi:hypothetical protein